MVTKCPFFPSLKELVAFSGKMELLDRIMPKLIRFGHRTLILITTIQTMNLMHYYFKKRDIEVVRLDPIYRPTAQKKELRDFKENKRQVVLATTDVRQLGWVLQQITTVLIMETEYTPTGEQEHLAQISKYGQHAPLKIIRVLTQSRFDEVNTNAHLIPDDMDVLPFGDAQAWPLDVETAREQGNMNPMPLGSEEPHDHVQRVYNLVRSAAAPPQHERGAGSSLVC